MKIIDVHAHIFPDELALKTVPKMAETAGIHEAIDGRRASLLQSMDTAGIAESWLQPVATKPTQIASILDFMESVRSDRLIPFGAVHPEYENLPALVEEMARRGFPGVKIHPEYHKTGPNDERYFPMYEALQDRNMIVLYHAGYDIGIPTLNSTPLQFLHLRERFPTLTLILAHMGGFQQWDEVMNILAGADFYLDTSYSLGHFSDEAFMALARKHGADRILFGTDTPWADQNKDVDHLRRLPFTQEELEGILGKNAETLLQKARKSTASF